MHSITLKPSIYTVRNKKFWEEFMMPAFHRVFQSTAHRFEAGEAVAMGKQVALSILLPFLHNISFLLSCAAQMLIV
jgi:hypothetical protein